MRRRWWALVVIGMLLPAVQVVPGSATASAPVISAACDQNVKPGYYACFAERVVQPNRSGTASRAAVAPSGYSPSQLASAYGFGSAPSGAGRRIYVIGAFDDRNAASDLAIYRSQFGLPACTVGNGCFQKLNQHGATSPMPIFDQGWAVETSLDLDMVSAACPACSITLIEANDPSNNLLLATGEAKRFGAQYVSMSWGGPDDQYDAPSDAAYLSRTGVFYSVATGDGGFTGGVSYPSTSPYVVAVGGTSLTPTPSGSRAWSESAWSGASSGCTSNEAKPGYQASASTSCGGRAVADISADADPTTGVAVYDSSDQGWEVVGGTSAAAPLVAGIAARADAAIGAPSAYPYAHTGEYNDVTTGSNAALCLSGVLCNAGPGWDGPTGLGTPRSIAALGNPTTAEASRCTGNLVNNSGFELGTTGWSVAAARIHTRHRLAHTGNRFALLDGTGHTHVDRLARALVLPKGCVSTLTYFLRVSSADRSRIAHDKLLLMVNGTVLSMRSNLARGPRYFKVTIHLNRYAGRTVNIKWVGRENASLATSFYLDDVRVTLSR
ncbi:MAG: hypothetical protein JWR52_3405 [Marmoricola sp.]|nr:hypothetical protein [Marmoricola sp.]